MKKVIIVIAVSFLFVQLSKAEIFQFGIKAGLAYSNIRIDDIALTGAYDMVTGDGVLGYHVGIQTRVKLAMLFVQPELYFNAGGGTLEKVVDGGASELMEVKFNSVDLPVLVGAKLGPVRINLGPVGSYVVKESIVNDISDIPADYTFFTNKMTWGIQAGLGADLFGKLSIDARYEGSLSKLGEAVGIDQIELDARPRKWVFSVGFWF
jgi:hypothetical protein